MKMCWKKIAQGLETLITILSSNKLGLSLSYFSLSHRVFLPLVTAKQFLAERTSPMGLGSCCWKRLTFTKCHVHYHVFHRYNISVLEDWHSSLPLPYGMLGSIVWYILRNIFHHFQKVLVGLHFSKGFEGWKNELWTALCTPLSLIILIVPAIKHTEEQFFLIYFCI